MAVVKQCDQCGAFMSGSSETCSKCGGSARIRSVFIDQESTGGGVRVPITSLPLSSLIQPGSAGSVFSPLSGVTLSSSLGLDASRSTTFYASSSDTAKMEADKRGLEERLSKFGEQLRDLEGKYREARERERKAHEALLEAQKRETAKEEQVKAHEQATVAAKVAAQELRQKQDLAHLLSRVGVEAVTVATGAGWLGLR